MTSQYLTQPMRSLQEVALRKQLRDYAERTGIILEHKRHLDGEPHYLPYVMGCPKVYEPN